MEYTIRNIYNQDVIKFDGDYVKLHSGIEVAWISTNDNITTITLLVEHYRVSITNEKVIDIKRG